MTKDIKLISGGLAFPVTCEETEDSLFLSFGYNKGLLAEIKARFKGIKWLGYDEVNPRKVWKLPKCPRNDFQLKVLQGLNPYSKYDTELDLSLVKTERQLYNHQRELVAHGLTYKWGIWAAEPGTGKTLAAIEVMEEAQRRGIMNQWYIGPKGALPGVKLDFSKWKSKVRPLWFTYDELKITLKNWTAGMRPPQLIIFDEAQKLKNETSQRSQASTYISDHMRSIYGDNSFIILMTGTPAPKSPKDWYNLCETACPGFIKEGDIYRFQNRLAIVTNVNDVTGGRYPKLVAWRDGNPKLCNVCGLDQDEDVHDLGNVMVDDIHAFVPMVDEIKGLYGRMRGLTMVKLKSECLDLPKKVYKTFNVEPTREILNAARLIKAGAPNAVTALTLLRELSDGFQYGKEVSSNEPCETCKTTKVVTVDDQQISCPMCNGVGTKPIYDRTSTEINTAKLEGLGEILETDFEEDNRIVIYAGFEKSIDLIEKYLEAKDWTVIRIDGRGWKSSLLGDPVELLRKFQDYEVFKQKIAIVGHPGSAGIGLTLTASKGIIYYSNDFNGEYRMQSEDRLDRPSCRGQLIIDLVHLPSDELVLQNLKRKRELQAMSMNDIAKALEYSDDRTT